MEVKKVKSEQIGEAVHSNDRKVWLRYYRMTKVRINRDQDGAIVSEHPFTEFVYSLFVVGNKTPIWIKADAMFSLREALDILAGASAEAEEEQLVLALEQVRRGD